MPLPPGGLVRPHRSHTPAPGPDNCYISNLFFLEHLEIYLVLKTMQHKYQLGLLILVFPEAWNFSWLFVIHLQVPQFILDDMIESELGGNCNIVCTQPRRIAV